MLFTFATEAMSLFKSDFLKNVTTLVSGSAIAQAIGFILLPFFTRLYSVESFGSFTLFATLVGVGIVFSGLRLELGIVAEDDEETAQDLVVSAFLANLGIAFILYLVLALFWPQIYALLNIDTRLSWPFAVPLIIALTGSSECLIQWYNRNKRYTKMTASKVTNSITTNSVKLAYPLANISLFNGLIIGQIIGQAVTFIYLSYKIGMSFIASINRRNLLRAVKSHKNLVLFSSPAALVNVLALSMPIFLLAHFVSTDETAFFGTAKTLIFVPLGFISMAVSQVFYERLSRLKNDKQETSKLSHQIINLLFALAIVPALATAIWGNDLVPFILGSEWVESGVIAQVMVFFFFMLYLTSPFSGAFVVYNKLKYQLVYNTVFLLATSTTMYLLLLQGYSSIEALSGFALVGIILRIWVLNYFFFLFGKSLIRKTILAVVIIALVLFAGFSVTDTWPL
jgi:O-antigen/teichoic acid export membrane protein